MDPDSSRVLNIEIKIEEDKSQAQNLYEYGDIT
jgi:hypothetical protein